METSGTSRPERFFPLFSSISNLSGVGPRATLALKKLGVERVRDLLFLLPVGGIKRRKVFDLVSIFQQINSQHIILRQLAPLTANILFNIQLSNFFSASYFSESEESLLFPIVTGFRNTCTRRAVACLIRLFKL